MNSRNELPAEGILAKDGIDTGPFISLRVWLAGSPWRMTGAWLALAGMVATAGLRVTHLSPMTVLLALLLAEAIWGALWVQLAAQPGHGGVTTDRRPMLPYISPSSPAGRLLGWHQTGTLAAWLRHGLPTIVLGILVAILVGTSALLLTGLAIALGLVGAVVGRAGLQGWVCWLQALLLAALPFALGVSLLGPWPDIPQGAWLLVAAGSFTLFARAAVELTTCNRPVRSSTTLILSAVGSGLIVIMLLLLHRPLGAGLVALLSAGPLLMLARPATALPKIVQIWWWLMVLCTAAILGLGIG